MHGAADGFVKVFLMASTSSFVVVASRLPVDRVEGPDGEASWRPSPGGLVTALEPVMRGAEGVWIGWSGDAGPAPGPFKAGGMHLVGIGLSAEEIRDYYEGFCNATLWPLYHDVIAPPRFHRRWWDAYVAVNRYFAEEADRQAGPGATVWVHDYQLQLVPQLLRERRGDVRIGYFTHIPFPGYEIFAQLPWRRQVVNGLLGADLLGFQRRADATNFLRACRRAAGLVTRGPTVRVGDREVRVAAFPISIDEEGLEQIARRESVRKRAAEIRAALNEPDTVLLGIDRLDYTKGITHRLRAYGELLRDGRLGPRVVLVNVASPSRERVGAYRALRDKHPALDARATLIAASGVRTPLLFDRIGAVARLPSLAEMKSAANVEFDSAPFQLGIELRCAAAPSTRIDVAELAASLAQVNSAVAKLAGPLSLIVPKLTAAFFPDAVGAQAMMSDGHMVALPVFAAPIIGQVPYIEPGVLAGAKMVMLVRAPSRIVLGGHPKKA